MEPGEFVAVIRAERLRQVHPAASPLGGLDRPTSGTVTIDGNDLTNLSDARPTELRRHKIGFIFQFFNRIPVLNAVENAALPITLDGVRQAEAKERPPTGCAKVGLRERLDHRPDQLSGGQQQRVAVARALVADPALILADEPTGNLDTRAGEEIAALLRQVANEGGGRSLL